MRKVFILFVLIGTVAGGVYFHQKYEVIGLDQVVIQPRDPSAIAPVALDGRFPKAALPGGAARRAIRIGSFALKDFGPKKESKPNVMEVLIEVLRGFDVVALQGVDSKDQTLIPKLRDLVNADGAHFEYVLGPRLGRSATKEQYVFLFDSDVMEVDRGATYTVDDPLDRMHRQPLVALFRVRSVAPEDAFTFKLVNVHTDPDDIPEELNALADVFRAVRDDGDHEDDVILLGSFNTGPKHLHALGEISGLTPALVNATTDIRRTVSHDNLYFTDQETTEFNGRADVVDLVRTFNLTTDEALEVSDHLPVWAEFSPYEGGRARSVASLPDEPARTR